MHASIARRLSAAFGSLPSAVHRPRVHRHLRVLPSAATAIPVSPSRVAGVPVRYESRSSVDEAEVRKFGQQAAQWWDKERGPFAGLHSMNAVRVPFIVKSIRRARTLASTSADAAAHTTKLGSRPLEGYTVVDVGCGGGILAEALARLGADTLGADASDDNVRAAAAHAALDASLAERLRYRAVTAESLVEEGAKFDCVVTSEVIEHVADPAEFARSCAALVKPGGVLVITTINRTAASMLAAIVGAEYVLRIVPRGTHEWSKFVTPEELRDALTPCGMTVTDVEGFGYSPIDQSWYSNGQFTGINYAVAAVKATE